MIFRQYLRQSASAIADRTGFGQPSKEELEEETWEYLEYEDDTPGLLNEGDLHYYHGSRYYSYLYWKSLVGSCF